MILLRLALGRLPDQFIRIVRLAAAGRAFDPREALVALPPANGCWCGGSSPAWRDAGPGHERGRAPGHRRRWWPHPAPSGLMQAW